MPEKIKKYRNNHFVLSDKNIWVRDFTSTNYIDINALSNDADYKLFLNNEIENNNKKIKLLDYSTYFYNNIIIVSDGYNFKEYQNILSKIPKNKVSIIAVNGALSNWKLVGNSCEPEKRRAITWYIVNNPYPECIKFLPTRHRYFPRCIASSRTNPKFINKYEGEVLLYVPAHNKDYSGPIESQYKIDDYRNPVCAAINLAYRFRVKKLLLFCCDDSFADSRPYAEQLNNGLYSYPQQQLSRKIIDANLYWLKNHNVKIGDFSKGIKLNNANYINDEHSIVEFFKDDDT